MKWFNVKEMNIKPVCQVIAKEDGSSWYCGYTLNKTVQEEIDRLGKLMNIGFTVMMLDGTPYGGRWNNLQDAIWHLKDGCVLIHQCEYFIPNLYVVAKEITSVLEEVCVDNYKP